MRRPSHTLLVAVAGLACITGVLSLLLADSTQCANGTIDLTYDVTTTCNGGQSGRINISGDVGNTQPGFTPQTVSGTIHVDTVTLYGSCPNHSKPKFDRMQLDLGTHSCSVNLNTQLGQPVSCDLGPDGGAVGSDAGIAGSDAGIGVDGGAGAGSGCTLTLTAVP